MRPLALRLSRTGLNGLCHRDAEARECGKGRRLRSGNLVGLGGSGDVAGCTVCVFDKVLHSLGFGRTFGRTAVVLHHPL